MGRRFFRTHHPFLTKRDKLGEEIKSPRNTGKTIVHGNVLRNMAVAANPNFLKRFVRNKIKTGAEQQKTV